MPKQETATSILELSLLIGVLGFVALLAIIIVGIWLFYRKNEKLYNSDNIDKVISFWKENGQKPNLPKYATDSYVEYLQRRNEFWVCFGQVTLAVFIVMVLSILLITRTISAEAGLPIISAVSGFAIAKGVQSNKQTSNSDRDNI